MIGISARTLQRRYADLIEENKNKGKASLRKRMWERALKRALKNAYLVIKELSQHGRQSSYYTICRTTATYNRS